MHGRDLRVVADELALGDRGAPSRPGNSTLSRLVRRQLAARERATGPCARGRRARRARRSVGASPGASARRRPTAAAAAGDAALPQRGRGRGDLVVGAAADHRTRMVLRVPALARVRRRRLWKEPLVLAVRRGRGGRATNRPASFSPCRSKCSSPCRDGAPRGRRCARAPRSRGPRRSRRRRRTRPSGSRPRSRRTRADGPRRARRVCRAAGSSVGPRGTAQLTSTPSISSRKS